MDITRRRLLLLLPSAAVAWKFVQAGTPEAAPNYKTSEHWWGMLIDIPKCIGCGSCVRACAAENDVPDGYLPHMDRAVSRDGLTRSSARRWSRPMAESKGSR